MKQVQRPKKPLIVYYLIALAALILINWVIFPHDDSGEYYRSGLRYVPHHGRE